METLPCLRGYGHWNLSLGFQRLSAEVRTFTGHKNGGGGQAALLLRPGAAGDGSGGLDHSSGRW